MTAVNAGLNVSRLWASSWNTAEVTQRAIIMPKLKRFLLFGAESQLCGAQDVRAAVSRRGEGAQEQTWPELFGPVLLVKGGKVVVEALESLDGGPVVQLGLERPHTVPGDKRRLQLPVARSINRACSRSSATDSRLYASFGHQVDTAFAGASGPDATASDP